MKNSQTAEEKHEAKIRTRKSYAMFKEWNDFLPVQEDTRRVLNKLFSELDRHNAFGSQTMADFARESLELLIKDENL